MTLRRGLHRLWAVVSTLWIGFCVAVGSRLGFHPAYAKECRREVPGGVRFCGPPGFYTPDPDPRSEELREILRRNPPKPPAGEILRRNPPKPPGGAVRTPPKPNPGPLEPAGVETTVTPARMDWLGLGRFVAVFGIGGAGLLYGVGAAVAWVVRGFR